MLSDFSEVWSGDAPSLVATWDKYWSTHMILQHSSADRFAMRSGILFPAPFPNDTESRAFMVEFGGIRDSAKFTFSEVSPKGLKVDGFAIKDIWGAGIYATELKGENRDSAEIWFDKVGAL